jgi:hypothetical protein
VQNIIGKVPRQEYGGGMLETRQKPWLGAYLGLGEREYISLARFSSKAEALGLKLESIDKGRPFGGASLRLAGKAGNSYEVVVNGAGLLLGKVTNDGTRIRLYAGSTTEASWNTLLARLKASEGLTV